MPSFDVMGKEHPAAHWIGASGAVLAFQTDEDIVFPSGPVEKGSWLVFDFREMTVHQRDSFVATHIQRYPKAADAESPEKYTPPGRSPLQTA